MYCDGDHHNIIETADRPNWTHLACRHCDWRTPMIHKYDLEEWIEHLYETPPGKEVALTQDWYQNES